MVLGQPFWKYKESGCANFRSGSKLAPGSIEKPDRQISKDKEGHKRSGIAVSIDWVFEGLGKWSRNVFIGACFVDAAHCS